MSRKCNVIPQSVPSKCVGDSGHCSLTVLDGVIWKCYYITCSGDFFLTLSISNAQLKRRLSVKRVFRGGVSNPRAVAHFQALSHSELGHRSGGWAHVHIPTCASIRCSPFARAAGTEIELHMCMLAHCSCRTIFSPSWVVHKATKIGELWFRRFRKGDWCLWVCLDS